MDLEIFLGSRAGVAEYLVGGKQLAGLFVLAAVSGDNFVYMLLKDKKERFIA